MVEEKEVILGWNGAVRVKWGKAKERIFESVQAAVDFYWNNAEFTEEGHIARRSAPKYAEAVYLTAPEVSEELAEGLLKKVKGPDVLETLNTQSSRELLVQALDNWIVKSKLRIAESADKLIDLHSILKSRYAQERFQ